MTRKPHEKNSATPVEPEIVEPVEVEKPKREQRKRVRRTTVEEFSEPIPVDAEPAEAEADEEDDAEEGEPAREPTTVERILSEISSEMNAVVVVTRLPDGVTYRGMFATPCRGRASCEPIPVEEGMSVEDIYAACRESNGGGRYQFQLRFGRGFSEAWEHVLYDPPAVRAHAQQSNNSTATAAPPPAAAPPSFRSDLQRLKDTAQELKELRELMGWNPPAPESRQIEAPPARKTDLELIAALPEGSLRDKLVDRVFPAEEEKSSIVGDILRHPQEALTIIQQGVALLAPMFMRGQQQASGNGQQQQQVNPLFQFLEPYRPELSALCVEMMNNEEGSEERCAADLKAKAAADPAFALVLPQIVSMSSVQIITTLAEFTRNAMLPALRHAPAWIEEVQSILSGEEEEGEGVEASG